jgi:hypothetical protein
MARRLVTRLVSATHRRTVPRVSLHTQAHRRVWPTAGHQCNPLGPMRLPLPMYPPNGLLVPWPHLGGVACFLRHGQEKAASLGASRRRLLPARGLLCAESPSSPSPTTNQNGDLEPHLLSSLTSSLPNPSNTLFTQKKTLIITSTCFNLFALFSLQYFLAIFLRHACKRASFLFQTNQTQLLFFCTFVFCFYLPCYSASFFFSSCASRKLRIKEIYHPPANKNGTGNRGHLFLSFCFLFCVGLPDTNRSHHPFQLPFLSCFFFAQPWWSALFFFSCLPFSSFYISSHFSFAEMCTAWEETRTASSKGKDECRQMNLTAHAHSTALFCTISERSCFVAPVTAHILSSLMVCLFFMRNHPPPCFLYFFYLSCRIYQKTSRARFVRFCCFATPRGEEEKKEEKNQERHQLRQSPFL